MLFQKRSIVPMIFLQFLTCSLYSLYWTVVVQDEVKLNDPENKHLSGIAVLILSIVTLGLYHIYWMYKLTININRLGEKVGIENPHDELIMLFLALFTIGIVYKIVMQDRINQMVDAA